MSGLRSALSGGAPAWALLFAVMMWIGGGMGAGMGLIDINSLPVHRGARLERHRIPRVEGRPHHVGHLAWRLTGGELGRRFGIKTVLWWGIIVGASLTTLWSAGRSQWGDAGVMTLVWIVWTFVWGIVGNNVIALLMSLTESDLGGTQFSLYMTLINVGALSGTLLSPSVLEPLTATSPTSSSSAPCCSLPALPAEQDSWCQHLGPESLMLTVRLKPSDAQ